MAKKGYYIVTKNNKKNLILMLVILVIACVLLAIISLIPNKFKDKWLNTDNGVARSAMYPFVYLSDNSLFVLKEDMSVIPVDDSVSNSIHDVNYNSVFYLRDSQLYEYDIDTNVRKSLSDGVVSFRLFSERTSILCTNNINDIYLYLYKEKGNVKLNKASLQNIHSDTCYYLVGNECVVFLDSFNAEKNTASLMYSNLEGKIKCIAEDIDITKKFSISSDDKYVLYYKNNEMVIATMDGNVLRKYNNAKVINQSSYPVLTEPCTEVKYYSDGIDFTYFLVNISESGSNGDLVYFDDKFVQIDKNIRSVVHFHDDDKMVIYTKNDADGKITLYKCLKGDSPTSVITCNSSDSFFYNESSSFLYIQSAEGYLRRLNIFDSGYKVTDIAEGTGVMYDYVGKSFVAYHDMDGNSQYLILNTNVIEEFSMNEIRYYGKYSNKYLLCREYKQGVFSLDYVVDGKISRISNNIDKNIYFDKEFENVIFTHNNEMLIWKDNAVSKIGMSSGILSVPILSKR